MTGTAPPLLEPERRRQLDDELERLIASQLGRVRRRYALHGACIALLLPTLAIALFFALDYVLRLPAPIRVFHAVLTAGIAVVAALRFVHYPLSRRFSRVDIALLLERAFPELREQLVSAVQLKQGIGERADPAVLRNQSAAMVERVVEAAAAEARRLPLERLFDARRTSRIGAAAAALLLMLLGGAMSWPEVAGAFLQRHLGLEVQYPRTTYLTIELPPDGPDLQRRDFEDRIEVLLPVGADLHVSVLAEGVVPAEAMLDITTPGGEQRSVAMAPRPGNRFRHVFRRVQMPFEFHARGGDDEYGDRRVRVLTARPPLVAQIKAELRPPAYTGQEPTVQRGGAIEALAGTEVSLSVVATAPASSAELVFLESGLRLPLQAMRIVDDGGEVAAHVGTFTVAKADRYQVDLVGDGGLRNPTPGTYPVVVLQDYAPVGRWLVPEDESATLLLAEALLCVRVEARDDFGLLAATLVVDGGAGATRTISLLQRGDGGPVREVACLELLELKDLLGPQRSTTGLTLVVDLTDNRQPEPGVAQLPRRQVQIVDQNQLSAAIARHFRSLREEVEQSLSLQLDRRLRLEDLREQRPAPGTATAQVLTAIEVGQGRIQGSADRLHRGTMRAFDQHLWNRLDPSPNAATVVELYREFFERRSDPVALHPDFYRDLAGRRQRGTLGAMETTLDPILAMVVLADRLATELLPGTLRHLAQAQVARDERELQALLTRIDDLQGRIVTTLQDLLGRLDEWNDYQDLVQEARALREKQREVQNRTEDLRGKR